MSYKAASPLVAELAQCPMHSHFASLIQAAPRNLSSPHDPSAERGASSLSMGLEGAWGVPGTELGFSTPGRTALIWRAAAWPQGLFTSLEWVSELRVRDQMSAKVLTASCH